MKATRICWFFFSLFSTAVFSQWDEDTTLATSDGRWSVEFRENIYSLTSEQWKASIQKGQNHALVYPVTVTGLLIPYRPLKKFLEDSGSPFQRWLYTQTQRRMPFDSMDTFYDWLGINHFPEDESANLSQLIHPGPKMADERMGASLIERGGADGITFSCAACHSGELFGKKVLGMTNRFPRAFELFQMGTKYIKYFDAFFYQGFFSATKEEALMYDQTRAAAKWVGTRSPENLGLDTSLALVALSLHKRADDEYATQIETHGPWNPRRKHPLEKMPMDSKPMPWWNVKYKTRWLSDGSVVSGNPVFTNILWNEIGRGVDLKKLEAWLINNETKLKELTTAVFASRPPSPWEFFDPCKFDLAAAMRGQKLFQNNCQKCHGQYEKAWDQKESNLKQSISTSACAENLATSKVHYHAKTPVIDVGTDPNRYLGVQYFADDLNKLKISKTFKTVVRPQKGYVPPPLVGIWARYPYFHNNSAPTLEQVLTPGDKRLKNYWMVPARNQIVDFDWSTNGYPSSDRIADEWKKQTEYFYDSSRSGLSNVGHDKGILLTPEGSEKFSNEEKRDLIRFLQTL